MKVTLTVLTLTLNNENEAVQEHITQLIYLVLRNTSMSFIFFDILMPF